MEGADHKAAMIVIRAQERRATLFGSNAPLRVDPIALAADVGQPLSSTDQLRQVFNEWRALDKKRLRNGGEGYGPNSWQDIQDREEMARKAEREKAKADD
jgi:hypothetical protein